MVRLQKLLLDHLGVERIELVIGGSMGGMQVLGWAEQYPEVVDAIVPIGVGSAQSAWALALSEVQRAAITGDQRFRGGRYPPARPPTSGLATARTIAMCSYRSADDFDANSYLALIDAMDSYRIEPNVIDTPALVVGISSDVLYPAQEVRTLAAALPQAEFGLLSAPQGHDAFLIETERLCKLITRFRKRLANRSRSGTSTGHGALFG